MGRFEGYLGLGSDDLRRLGEGFDRTANLLGHSGTTFLQGMEVGLKKRSLLQDQAQFEREQSLREQQAREANYLGRANLGLEEKKIRLDESRFGEERIQNRFSQSYSIATLDEQRRHAKALEDDADTQLRISQQSLDEQRYQGAWERLQATIESETKGLSALSGVDPAVVQMELSNIVNNNPNISENQFRSEVARRKSDIITRSQSIYDASNNYAWMIANGQVQEDFYKPITMASAANQLTSLGIRNYEDPTMNVYVASQIRHTAVVSARDLIDRKLSPLYEPLKAMANRPPSRDDGLEDPAFQLALQNNQMTKDDFRNMVKTIEDMSRYGQPLSQLQREILSLSGYASVKRYINDTKQTQQFHDRNAGRVSMQTSVNVAGSPYVAMPYMQGIQPFTSDPVTVPRALPPRPTTIPPRRIDAPMPIQQGGNW